jgi:hypothetical protein
MRGTQEWMKVTVKFEPGARNHRRFELTHLSAAILLRRDGSRPLFELLVLLQIVRRHSISVKTIEPRQCQGIVMRFVANRLQALTQSGPCRLPYRYAARTSLLPS